MYDVESILLTNMVVRCFVVYMNTSIAKLRTSAEPAVIGGLFDGTLAGSTLTVKR
jgi:hypothetical protein